MKQSAISIPIAFQLHCMLSSYIRCSRARRLAVSGAPTPIVGNQGTVYRPWEFGSENEDIVRTHAFPDDNDENNDENNGSSDDEDDHVNTSSNRRLSATLKTPKGRRRPPRGVYLRTWNRLGFACRDFGIHYLYCGISIKFQKWPTQLITNSSKCTLGRDFQRWMIRGRQFGRTIIRAKEDLHDFLERAAEFVCWRWI